MYNDNFASMAIYSLLVAGERFGITKYFEIGKEKLLDACDYFARCGVLTEHCSPTYTPVNLIAYAQIANHIKDAKIKEIALKCEERIWIEIAIHYHPSTRMAGPSARSYSIGSMGHTHNIDSLLWTVFGDRILINPMNDWFPMRENLQFHHSLELLEYPNSGWLINAEYHCPEYIYDLMFNKKLPYEALCITECIPSNALADTGTEMERLDYAGHRSSIYTYITEQYAMGTAENSFHSGSISDSFHITYKHADKPASIEDMGTIYTKYAFNDHLPGQRNTYTAYGNVGMDGYRDEGRKHGLQNKNISMVAYRPLHIDKDKVSCARLMILIPCHFNKNIDIRVGNEMVTGFSYESASLETVYVRAHKSFFAFIPVAATNLGRDIALSVEIINQHIAISFYNYRGEERAFTVKELRDTLAGFACIAGEDFDSLDSFAAYADKGRFVEDRNEYSEEGCLRRMKFIHENEELRMLISQVADGVLVSTVNKQPRGLNILKADGLDGIDIPFLCK